MEGLLIGEIHPEAKKLLTDLVKLEEISSENFLVPNFYPNIDLVVLRTFTQFRKEQLAWFPSLKYIVSCSVGLDNLDLEALRERQVEVIFAPGSNANSVAEHTIYLLFSLLREDLQRPFAELSGKIVGVVGFGAIGKLVARKLKGMGVQVVAFDVVAQDPKVIEELGVTMLDLNAVLERADVITIHVPAMKETEKMISRTCFEMMKRGSFFINTSRAEVVDEEALFMHATTLRGIALDVCSQELTNKLTHPNLLITDHIAAQGEDSFRKQCVEPTIKLKEKLHRA